MAVSLEGVRERVLYTFWLAFAKFHLLATRCRPNSLASSIAAARRREGDIVLGNIVGSNIFNVLCVLGVTALVRPITGDPAAVSMVGLALTVALVPVLLIGRRLYLGRVEDLLLLAAYGSYVGWLFR